MGPDAGFQLTNDTPLYVYKVSDWNTQRMIESCTLHLTSIEHFSNQAQGVEKYNFNRSISEHVEDISKKYITNKNIKVEPTANSYTFIE